MIRAKNCSSQVHMFVGEKHFNDNIKVTITTWRNFVQVFWKEFYFSKCEHTCKQNYDVGYKLWNKFDPAMVEEEVKKKIIISLILRHPDCFECHGRPWRWPNRFWSTLALLFRSSTLVLTFRSTIPTARRPNFGILSSQFYDFDGYAPVSSTSRWPTRCRPDCRPVEWWRTRLPWHVLPHVCCLATGPTERGRILWTTSDSRGRRGRIWTQKKAR